MLSSQRLLLTNGLNKIDLYNENSQRVIIDLDAIYAFYFLLKYSERSLPPTSMSGS